MKVKRGILLKTSVLGFMFLVFFTSQAFATIDSEIRDIFATYLSNDQTVMSCGVVDSVSGDIISRWIRNPKMESKSDYFAFTLRDVVKSVKKNLSSLGYSFRLIGIKFNRGFLLIAPVNNSAFVGCFYSSGLNEAKERLIFMRKIVPNIKSRF